MRIKYFISSLPIILLLLTKFLLFISKIFNNLFYDYPFYYQLNVFYPFVPEYYFHN